jgi:hypothetical protein
MYTVHLRKYIRKFPNILSLGDEIPPATSGNVLKEENEKVLMHHQTQKSKIYKKVLNI